MAVRRRLKTVEGTGFQGWTCRRRSSGPAKQSREQRQDQEGKKNEEQYFGNSGGCTGYSCKTKCASNDCYYQKYKSPVKHGSYSSNDFIKTSGSAYCSQRNVLA